MLVLLRSPSLTPKLRSVARSGHFADILCGLSHEVQCALDFASVNVYGSLRGCLAGHARCKSRSAKALTLSLETQGLRVCLQENLRSKSITSKTIPKAIPRPFLEAFLRHTVHNPSRVFQKGAPDSSFCLNQRAAGRGCPCLPPTARQPQDPAFYSAGDRAFAELKAVDGGEELERLGSTVC